MTIHGSARSWPRSTTRILPGRSLMKIRLSGAKSMAHGVFKPRAKTSTEYSVGAAPNESLLEQHNAVTIERIRAALLMAARKYGRGISCSPGRHFLEAASQWASKRCAAARSMRLVLLSWLIRALPRPRADPKNRDSEYHFLRGSFRWSRKARRD